MSLRLVQIKLSGMVGDIQEEFLLPTHQITMASHLPKLWEPDATIRGGLYLYCFHITSMLRGLRGIRDKEV